MPERVFRAQAPEDLALPVQAAFAEALAEGRDFRLRLPPLPYRPFHLSLQARGPGAGIGLTVEGEGARPVPLRGLTLALGGARVSLRNLCFEGAQSAAPILAVAVEDAFLGEGLAVLDNLRHDPSSQDPILDLWACGAAGARARAQLRNCWFVGNRTEGDAALLATPRHGRASFQELWIEGCAFRDNATTLGLDPWFTRSLQIAATCVLESGMPAWLHLRSPLVRTMIRDSVLSCGGELVRHALGPNVAPKDVPPIDASGSHCFAGSPPAPDTWTRDSGSTGPPLTQGEAGPDWRPLARSGRVPDPRQLFPALVAPEDRPRG